LFTRSEHVRSTEKKRFLEQYRWILDFMMILYWIKHADSKNIKIFEIWQTNFEIWGFDDEYNWTIIFDMMVCSEILKFSYVASISLFFQNNIFLMELKSIFVEPPKTKHVQKLLKFIYISRDVTVKIWKKIHSQKFWISCRK